MYKRTQGPEMGKKTSVFSNLKGASNREKHSRTIFYPNNAFKPFWTPAKTYIIHYKNSYIHLWAEFIFQVPVCTALSARASL